jgi:solute:Na+ symporter, SSS family
VRGIDATIIVVYLSLLLAVGFRFSRRQKSVETYYVAKRRIPPWAIGFSVMATIITSITFTAYPGAAYSGDWSLLVPNLMFVGVLLLVGAIVIPFFRDSVALSAYSYFRQRFGSGVQIYASVAFAIGHLSKAAFVVYLLALTLNSVTGWSATYVVIGAGAVAILYASVGGIEAVVWADVVQSFVLWSGILVTLGFLLFLPPGGAHAALAEAWSHRKISLGTPSFDLTRPTIPVLITYGFFFYLQKYTADQTVVQRYLIARDEKEAKRGIAIGAVLCVPVWAAFMLIGSLLWSFYRLTGERLASSISKPDQVFPHFLITHLAPGAAGLFLAAFLGAAISMLASDINSLSLICVEDLYCYLNPRVTDRDRLRAGKLMAVLAGVCIVLFALQLQQIQGAALSAYYTVTAIAAGGLAGLFLLGFLTRRASTRGTQVGIVACVAVTLWASLTSGSGRLIDLGRFNFPWHDYLIGAAGHFTLFTCGYLSSFFLPNAQPTQSRLTLWGWLEERKLRSEQSSSNARCETSHS